MCQNGTDRQLRHILLIGHQVGARAWEHALLARLETLGHAVSVKTLAGSRSGAGLDFVLAVERRRFGPSLASRSAPLAECIAGSPDLVVDLTGMAGAADGPVLRVAFNGQADLAVGLAALLADGGPPELVARLDGVAVGVARPMLRDRLWLSRLGDDLLAGAIGLIVHCVARVLAGQVRALADDAVFRPAPAPVGFGRAYLSAMASGIADRIVRKIRLRGRPFYWQVAYRMIDGPGIAETGRLDGPPFAVLADDGQRFYADPFLFARDGRTWLFVEEFPYAAGRGLISVAELGAVGTFSVPRPVLTEAHHLSYPQVFEDQGEIFMIPESSAAGEVVLYRAEDFPDRWLRDTVLLAGIDFNDATLLRHDGLFWLFGTERHGRGSPSDSMAVYVADALRGPWRVHRFNPLVIDRSAARPGGALISTGAGIVLPVQDGARAYGGGLGLVDVLRVDADDVVFGPVRPILPGPAWARAGIHTLNRLGRVEVVDSAG
jgi:hypothetical protein